MISFSIQQKMDQTGTEVATLVKEVDGACEDWCTIQELDRLFDSCHSRWGNNWNLEKLMLAVRECEFD